MHVCLGFPVSLMYPSSFDSLQERSAGVGCCCSPWSGWDAPKSSIPRQIFHSGAGDANWEAQTCADPVEQRHLSTLITEMAINKNAEGTSKLCFSRGKLSR